MYLCQQICQVLDEQLASLGSDRARSALLDMDKRATFASETAQTLEAIRKSLAKLKALDEDSLSTLLHGMSRAKITTSSSLTVAPPTEGGVRDGEPALGVAGQACLDDEAFLTGSLGSLDPPQVSVESTDADGIVHLNVAFDGATRYAARLSVHPVIDDSTTNGDGDQSSGARFDLKSKEAPLIDHAPAEAYMIKSKSVKPSGEETEQIYGNIKAVDVSLTSFSTIRGDESVALCDRVVIPKDETDIFARLIRTNQTLFKELSVNIDEKLHLFEHLHLSEISKTYEARRVEWATVEALYVKQRVWRIVGSGVLKGMRDQRPDFNKHADESLPASWTIKVDGRPKKEETPEEPDEQEDAVCMVCFDGGSSDYNKILFCDGCNATLHQTCYGVPEVPDGDFFCDRCSAVQSLAIQAPDFSSEEAKDAVKCCLCPLYHGGLKPTTDGRWVHLCCALWSPPALILDLNEMSPIDLTAVPVQVPDEDMSYSSTARSARQIEFAKTYTISDIEQVCGFCKVRGGRVVRCCAESDDEDECSAVFHPLCAWFQGLYVTTVLTDPSYRGVTRDGQFPSGIEYALYCNSHCNTVIASKPAFGSSTSAPPPLTATLVADPRGEQRALRQKYKINELDLEHIPGKGHRRRKKKLKQRETSDRATTVHRVKELTKDVYDSSKCACCLLPFDLSLFDELVPVSSAVAASSSSEAVDTTSTLETIDVDTTVAATVLEVKPPSQLSLDSSEFNGYLRSYELLCQECATIPLPDLDAPLPADKKSATSATEGTTADGITDGQGDDNEEEKGETEPKEKVLVPDGTAPQSSPSKLYPKPDIGRSLTLIREHLQPPPFPAGELVKIPSSPTAVVAHFSSSSSSDVKPYSAYPDKLTCSKCAVVCHTKCIHPNLATLSSMGDLTQWTCAPCQAEESDPRCAFCPRRGGLYRKTRTDSWIHQYCANNSAATVKLQPDGVVEIATIPKDSKKHVCFVCNRKEGVFNRCSSLGCTTFYHSLCGERSGKVYAYTRWGERTEFCYQHVPEGVEKNPRGWWVDVNEMLRLKFVLDRSRIVVDTLTRRERLKKSQCKLDGDEFARKFTRSLNHVKGRKSKDGETGFELSDGEEADESESDADSVEGTKQGATRHAWQVLPTENPLDVITNGGVPVHISGSFVRGGEVKPPLALVVDFAGVQITKKELEPTYDAYASKVSSMIQKNLIAIRIRQPMFHTSQTEADAFSDSLKAQLHRNMALSDKKFYAEMEKANIKSVGKNKVDFEYFLHRDMKATSSSSAVKCGPMSPVPSSPMAKKGKKGKRKRTDDDSTGERRRGRPPRAALYDSDDEEEDGVESEEVDEADFLIPAPVEKSFTAKKGAVAPLAVPKPSKVVKAALVDKAKSPVPPAPEPVTQKATILPPPKQAPAIPPPVFVPLHTMEKELAENSLFASLKGTFDSGDIDFSAIYALAGLDSTSSSSSVEKPLANGDIVRPIVGEWDICTDPAKRTRLEAQIMDILGDIDAYEVPLERALSSSSSSSAAKPRALSKIDLDTRVSSRKKSKPALFAHDAGGDEVAASQSKGKGRGKGKSQPASSSPEKPTRFLIGEFTEIPDAEAIPYYDAHVRRRLTTSVIREQVQRHRYSCMAAFSKDFYELLNNGLYATKQDAEVVPLYEPPISDIYFLGIRLSVYMCMLDVS